MPECVGIARCKEAVKLGPFFVSEAGTMVIATPVLQVDVFVGHVKITTKDQRLVGTQTVNICEKSIFPLLPIVETF